MGVIQMHDHACDRRTRIPTEKLILSSGTRSAGVAEGWHKPRECHNGGMIGTRRKSANGSFLELPYGLFHLLRHFFETGGVLNRHFRCFDPTTICQDVPLWFG